jgi:DNA adenine methylase
MQYFGGKQRIAKRVATYIQTFSPQSYLEPFCGACNVGMYIQAPQRVLSDSHKKLIAMWSSVMAGWLPPMTVTKDQYDAAKRGDYPDDLTAFIGFGCSFAGKYFGGHAHIDKRTGRNYATNAHNSLIKKRDLLAGSEFIYADYKDILDCFIEADVVYCDPPYVNTTGYSTGKFDTAEFWRVVRQHAKEKVVLVSEYKAPQDFECVLEISTNTEIRTSANIRDPRVERIFRYSKGK